MRTDKEIILLWMILEPMLGVTISSHFNVNFPKLLLMTASKM